MLFGGKINFPSVLLKELVSNFVFHNSREGYSKSDFDFIYRGHFQDITKHQRAVVWGIPNDNTPQELEGLSLKKLTKTQRAEFAQYIKCYKAIYQFCKIVLEKAIRLSSLYPNIVKAICNATEIKHLTKGIKKSKDIKKLIPQHIFMIALHAQFLKKKTATAISVAKEHKKAAPRKYIKFIQNNFIRQNILSRVKFMGSNYRSLESDANKINYYFRKQREDFNNTHGSAISTLLENPDKIWIFITVTARGDKHPNSPKWNGDSPQKTAIQFQNGWADIRPLLRHHKIDVSGFWTLEFHADSCPHRNFFIVVDRRRVADLKKVFKTVYKDESRVSHFKVGKVKKEKLIPAKAISYMIKYVFPYVSESNKEERLVDRALASLFGLNMIATFGI